MKSPVDFLAPSPRKILELHGEPPSQVSARIVTMNPTEKRIGPGGTGPYRAWRLRGLGGDVSWVEERNHLSSPNISSRLHIEFLPFLDKILLITSILSNSPSKTCAEY
jgi:hypothetical protein